MTPDAERAKATARHAKWVASNRDAVNAYQRKRWAEASPERRKRSRELGRASWARRTPEQIEEHRRKQAAYAKHRRKTDPENAYAPLRKYRATHRLLVREREKQRRLLHPERHKAAHKKWRLKNGWRLKLNRAKYRALKMAATVNLAGIKEFVAAIKSKAFAHCYYCERRTPTADIHFDHIVPLSKGGAHSVENLCVACAHCNHSKHNKALSEWARTNIAQQLLPL
jgi:5-methylcytosine-specific restriction endonuclease McrA